MKYEDLQHVLCHLNISIPPCSKVSVGPLALWLGPSLPQAQGTALAVLTCSTWPCQAAQEVKEEQWCQGRAAALFASC